MTRDAQISDCGAYRYWLSRRWNAEGKRVVFVMLNPSTADASIDDPTIRKCVGFASRAGYSCLDVVNLFAFRSVDPKVLRYSHNAVGPDNDGWIDIRCRGADVVFAWGANGAHHSARAKAVAHRVVAIANRILVIDWGKTGHPVHPLMQPYFKGLTDSASHLMTLTLL